MMRMSATDAITESIKRYRDTGAQLTEDARERAESVVVELRRSGEERGRAVGDFFRKQLDHGREITESLTEGVRNQLESGLSLFGIATRSEVEELAKRLDAAERALQRSRAAAPGKTAGPARSKPAKKAPRAKSTASKAKRTPAKKTTAGRAKSTAVRKSS